MDRSDNTIEKRQDPHFEGLCESLSEMMSSSQTRRQREREIEIEKERFNKEIKWKIKIEEFSWKHVLEVERGTKTDSLPLALSPNDQIYEN